MKGNGYEDFDKKIKSLLENAEEEVPERAWEEISSRLDGLSKGGRTVTLKWRKIVSAAAVAAAVAVGVFVGRKVNSNYSNINVAESRVNPNPSPDVKEMDATDDRLGSLLSDNQGAAVSQAVVSGKTERIVNSPEPQAYDEGGILPETLPVASESSDAELIAETLSPEASGSEGEKVEKPVVGKGGTETEAVDPMSVLQWEDARKSRRKGGVSITAGGNISTNGDPASMSRKSMMMAPGTVAKTGVRQLSKESTYSLPVSFGLGFRYYFTDRFSLGTGLTYSLLERTFRGVYTEADGGLVVRSINSDIHNTLHYVGIPLNAYYDLLSSNRLSFYVHAGGELEKGVRNRYRIESSPKDVYYHESISGVQFSAEGGFGVEFRIGEHLGLYVDPSFKYYFDCDQPISIRTQQPLMFNFEAGLRFNFK